MPNSSNGPAGAWPPDAITRFAGEYLFLSNFFWSDVHFEGLQYPSVEHAFQAAKLPDNAARAAAGFCSRALTFGQAKRKGRAVPLRPDWAAVKEAVMAACLRSKFTSDAGLRRGLCATGTRMLVDGHSGSPDLIWGYHFPSQAGQNRMGHLLMQLRAELRTEGLSSGDVPAAAAAPGVAPGAAAARAPESDGALDAGCAAVGALYRLDWPVKCLLDGLPSGYADRMGSLAAARGLHGAVCVLLGRQICVGVSGAPAAVADWEHRMRTEHVDVNSKGRPCRERMLVRLLHAPVAPCGRPSSANFQRLDVSEWAALREAMARCTALDPDAVAAALGPEPPSLPRVQQAPGGVLLDGRLHSLCLDRAPVPTVGDALLDPGLPAPASWVPVPLQPPEGAGRPSIFGGRVCRQVDALLSAEEARGLVALAEDAGFGLAGSGRFNAVTRFALRCVIDAPAVARALTERLRPHLPAQSPHAPGGALVGVSERLRFLKYEPGMHHAGDHTDKSYADPARGVRSALTLQVYLNDGYEGGRTTFVSEQLVPVEPVPGRAIVFDHELYHRGGMVLEGTKYAIRTDILYSTDPTTAVKHEAARAEVPKTVPTQTAATEPGPQEGAAGKRRRARPRTQGGWAR